jgi:hypothetical protein
MEMRADIEYWWVPSHEGIEGNDKDNEHAKVAVERVEGMQKLAVSYKGWSMAKVQRRVPEGKWAKTEKWWKAKSNGKMGGYRLNKKRRMSEL